MKARPKIIHNLTRFFLLLGVGAAVFAQGPPRRQGPDMGFPPGPGGGSVIRFVGQVVKGAPFSGTGVTTFSETLSNGNTITRANCVKIYRDADGRTRREETPNSSACSATPRFIVITDPVAGTESILNPANNTYRQFKLRTPPNAGANRPPHAPGGNAANVQTGPATPPTITVPGTALVANGTQTTITIPAGQIGNAQPIVITSTRYFSSDLQVVVSSTRMDPLRGNTSYTLTNVSTNAPDPSLFTIPAGYTLQQGPGGRGLGKAQQEWLHRDGR